MSDFIKIQNRAEIQDYAPEFRGWRKAAKFNSAGKIIGKYQLISKMERPYSLADRIGRVCLGLLATVGSFGVLLVFSQTVRDLFTKEIEKTQRFGICIDPSPRTSHSRSTHSGDDLISGFFKLLFTPADWFLNGMT